MEKCSQHNGTYSLKWRPSIDQRSGGHPRDRLARPAVHVHRNPVEVAALSLVSCSVQASFFFADNDADIGSPLVVDAEPPEGVLRQAWLEGVGKERWCLGKSVAAPALVRGVRGEIDIGGAAPCAG